MPIEKEDFATLIKHGGGFTTLPNESIALIRDPAALAIWVYLCSKPDAWIVRRSDVCEQFGFGIDKYQGCMRLLRELGFVSQKRLRDENGVISGNKLTVSLLPNLNRERDLTVVAPQRDLPEYGKPELRLIPSLSKEVVSSKERISKKKIASSKIEIPEGINLTAWQEWIDYRKSKNKAVSSYAAKKQFELLLKYSPDQQQTVINQSIKNDYQGLFDLKQQTPQPQPPRRKLQEL